MPVIQNWEEDAAMFKKMVEHLPVIAYVFRNPNIVYANPFTEKIFGYTLQELQHLNFWDLAHPDIRKLSRERGIARLEGKKVDNTCVNKFIKKNGEVGWVEVSFVTTTVRGERVSILGGIDITENVRLKEDLQRAKDDLEIRVLQRTEDLNRKNQELLILNQKLNNVVQNISEGIIVVDRFHNIEILNPFHDRIPGEMSDEISKVIKSYISSDKDNFVKRMFDNKESFKDEEIFLLSEKNASFPMLASGTPILSEQGVVESAIIVLRPIEEVHRLVNRFSGARAKFRFENIITNNQVMLELIDKAKSAARSVSGILIEGESGTGKELFAQAIHNYSDRCYGPFLAINCGSIPRELIASELFGYEVGAFTGAKKKGNPGKFELASGGTLFLDEIGDMPLEQQVTLLRMLQERTNTRIGGHREIPVDIRIICATNKNLVEEMNKNNFRHDLYYRINVINLKIPALRERPEDIELLFKHFLKQEAKRYKNDIKQIDDKFFEYLNAYTWPGNIRELQNVVERMVNAMKKDILGIEHLPPEIGGKNPVLSLPMAEQKKQQNRTRLTMKDARDQFRLQSIEREKNRIIDLLMEHNGNISKVAAELKVSRTTLYKKMYDDLRDK